MNDEPKGRVLSMDDEHPIRVAVLCGSDRAKTVVWDRTAPVVTGNNDSWRLLELTEVPWRRMHLAPSYFEQPKRWDFTHYDVVMNIITDPDRNPRTLDVVERIMRELGLPVINRPAALRGITRDGVAARLAGIPGLVVPKVLRLVQPTIGDLYGQLQQADFCFPGIVRVAGTQIGETMRRVEGPADLEEVCGDPFNQYNLTEYVEFRSPDGLYRKMRFLFVGERIFIRHRIVSDSWNIHSGSRDGIMAGNAVLAAEEDGFVGAGVAGLPLRLQQALAEIRRRIGLDYFGMDCGMLPSGDFVLFEANPTMNVINSDGQLPSPGACRDACLGVAQALANLVRDKRMACA